MRGKRLLGIPTVVDRVIQQIQFSVNSYGFRSGRSAKQAALKCKKYIEAGYTWTVDIDLTKYFNTVNHEKLMRLLSETIEDSRMLSLIRKYLKSGVMINGVVQETEEGCPQSGNLFPLLSYIMLDEVRPNQTVTICMPLYIAGCQEDRMFAKEYPTIAVDGCNKACAKAGHGEVKRQG